MVHPWPRRSAGTAGTPAKALGTGCAAAVVVLLALAGCGHGPRPAAADGQPRLFEEAYSDIAKYYIEPVRPAALALAGLGGLATIDATFSLEQAGDEVVLHHGDSATRFAAPDARDAQGWAELTDAVLTTARERSPAVAALSSAKLDETVLERSMSVLDRVSHYLAPDRARERRAARDGFGGIGVSLDTEGKDIRIVEVMPETPAAEGGLHVNDVIVAIDGVETATLARDEIAQRLRGPIDTLVALAVTRAEVLKPLYFALQRTRIVPPTVSLREANGIAHLRVTGFNQDTAQRLSELLHQAHNDMGGRLHGIILDLRGNPGGLLDQSVDVASLFLDDAPVTSTIGRVPESVQYFTAPHREVEQLPLVVLVNGGSASASEIVAAALQDSGRAVVVGTASFGKGTVQNVQRMPDDGELTVTWSRLITPAGYILHEHGVVPTVCTANLPDDARGLATLWRSTAALSTELKRPRAGLDEAGWRKLRGLCPAEREDRKIDVQAAGRLLADPVLYARALGATPASRPITTARLMH